MQEVLSFLESQYYPLSAELLAYLAKCIKPHNLRKYFKLVQEGSVSDRMYFVESGLIRCYIKKGDREICKWFMTKGNVVIGIRSFFLGVKSREIIETVQPCVLWSISKAEFNEACDLFPEFRKIAQRLTEKYYCDADKRADDLRMLTPEELYETLATEHLHLLKKDSGLTEDDLASYMGVTVPTFRKARDAYNDKQKKLSNLS